MSFHLDPASDLYKMLNWICKHELQDTLWWTAWENKYSGQKEGEVRFYVNCNDLFYWASADLEEVFLSDLPDIEKAFEDYKAALPDEKTFLFQALELWACRKRGMRPQGCCYPTDQRLWPLYDACGPDRPDGPGISNRRPRAVTK